MDILNYIPFDIWNCITTYLEFIDIIKLIQTNKLFYNNISVIDFYNINIKYLNKLTDDILKNHKKIQYLYVKNNIKIKDINWMTNLKKLNANGSKCGLDQNG